MRMLVAVIPICLSMSSPIAAFSMLGRSVIRQVPTSQALTKQIRSSLSANDPGPSDDMRKWETMYQDNEKGNEMKNKEMKSQNISEVRVVTFDLDNTIWKTGAVISSANDALAEYLDSKGIFYENENRVEKVMGKIFQKDKGKYCPVLAEDIRNGIGEEYSWDNVKAPVLLTQLRIDAVMEILRNQTTEFEDELEDFAKEAFQVWTNARHAAIPSNLASSVLESLKRIRQLKTKDGKDVVVGAVTDGNSNPLKIDLLKEYFDFVVNAEIVGISKPDRRIYDAAISHVASNPKLKHVFNGCDTNNVDALMDMNLDWWVHIGDDFVKDIVASKDLRMRSIWCRELIMDKLAKEETKPEPKTNLEEFRKTVADQKMLTMSIGTDDYLTTTLHNEFADAIVDDFCNVAAVVLSWHEEGTQLASTQNIVNETDLPDYFSIVTPDDKPVNESAPEAKIGGRDEKANSKFCVECGENLPRAAKKKVIELEDEESKCSEKKNEEESDSDDDENDGVSKNQEVVVHNNDEESECSEEESDSDDDENDGVSDYEPSSHESDFEEEAEED